MQKSEDDVDQLEAVLPGGQRAFITRHDPSLADHDAVYAVNWFNTRSAWLYDFYNLIAARSVVAVGGVPVLKGRLVEKLHGSDDDCRNTILIVRYPAISRFKAMLESRYFQLASILRILAVQDFTFGLTKRQYEELQLPTEAPVRPDDCYLVIHFRGDWTLLERILAAGREVAIEPVYAGSVAALVSTGTAPSKVRATPCLMDAIVVFKCWDLATPRIICEAGPSQIGIGGTVSSFAGIYYRAI